MIVQEELTQPHQEDTDDTVTTEFVSIHETHHRDVNGVLPKHEDLELMIGTATTTSRRHVTIH